MRQLARITLAATTGSPDEQMAAPDETGSYGELIDEIDRLVKPLLSNQQDGSDTLGVSRGP